MQNASQTRAVSWKEWGVLAILLVGFLKIKNKKYLVLPSRIAQTTCGVDLANVTRQSERDK
jgi:hypothetical protein